MAPQATPDATFYDTELPRIPDNGNSQPYGQATARAVEQFGNTLTGVASATPSIWVQTVAPVISLISSVNSTS